MATLVFSQFFVWGQTQTMTDTHTDIATYRLKWARGRFNEKDKLILSFFTHCLTMVFFMHHTLDTRISVRPPRSDQPLWIHKRAVLDNSGRFAYS